MPEDSINVTAVGQVKKDEEKLKIEPFETPIKEAGCHYFLCCCAEGDKYKKADMVYEGIKTREQIKAELDAINKTCTCGLRLCGFLMHFAAYYCILYPIIMLIGMIPFIGAVGAVVLVFFAFLIACVTFLFIIACAWICARPWLAIVIFGFIAIMIVVGKMGTEKLKQEGYIHDEKSRHGSFF